MDDDHDGSCVAYLDVKMLRCVSDLRRERLKLSGDNGEYWLQPEVQGFVHLEPKQGLQFRLPLEQWLG